MIFNFEDYDLEISEDAAMKYKELVGYDITKPIALGIITSDNIPYNNTKAIADAVIAYAKRHKEAEDRTKGITSISFNEEVSVIKDPKTNEFVILHADGTTRSLYD